jgi:hypothetical protein
MTQKNKPVLKIYCFSQPLLMTEWRSLLSDKFNLALPFDVELTDQPTMANVIAWDGVVSPKFERFQSRMQELLSNKTLLLMGEAQTLLAQHPIATLFSNADFRTVRLPGWSVLPEELMAALVECYQAGGHV